MYNYNEIKTIHLEVTQNCQASCPMCDRNMNGGKDNPNLGMHELSLDDIKEGKGTYNWPSGGKYEGDWKDGKKEGKGTWTYADGGKYEGYWKNDKKDGKGIMTYPDGRKYEEKWKGGERQ